MDIQTKAKLIAIVDDDELMRGALQGMLKSVGLSSQAFASAEEFLKSDSLPDTACLISDVQMPGMSGIELQARLLSERYRVPVIFVTAFSDPRARAQALASGALGFFDKPFSEDKLISCLDQALSGRKA